jgi:hypothetical protein
MRHRRALLALAVILPASSGHAEPITFVYEATGFATLDDVHLGLVDFVITGIGDTGSREQFNDAWFICHDATSIEVSGVGTLDFVDVTLATVVYNNTQAVSLEFMAALIYGPYDPVFATWDMLTDVGPVVGDASMPGWDDLPVHTTGGVLYIESAGAPATFTATIPAPNTLTLLMLIGRGLCRRRPG